MPNENWVAPIAQPVYITGTKYPDDWWDEARKKLHAEYAELQRRYAVKDAREGVDMNNVNWTHLKTTENLTVYAGKTPGPQNLYMLLCQTQNRELGQSWLQGQIKVSAQPNQEETEMATGYQAFVWEVAAVEEPTVKEQEGGAVSKLVLAPTAVLASSREGAIAVASKQITATYEPTRTRFIVRQFRGTEGV